VGLRGAHSDQVLITHGPKVSRGQCHQSLGPARGADELDFERIGALYEDDCPEITPL
jgi:hypothetical protein